MFIRLAKTHSSKSGPCFSARLCTSVRSGSRVKQITLLNLGSNFPVPQHRWKELAHLVQSIDQRDSFLIPPDPDLLRTAQHIAAQLRQRRSEQAPQAGPQGPLATVELDSIDHGPARSVGGERLALAAFDRLRLLPSLHAAGLSDRDARIALALLTARMLHPSSELEAHAWLTHHSSILELLGLERPQPPSLSKLYRIGDRLWLARQHIEDALARQERQLFDGSGALVFYDLTNVHTFAAAGGDRQFGRSKQRRNDCTLVTLALSVDDQGFPRRSAVLPGNVSEPATLEQAVQQLERDRSPAAGPKPAVVMDAGICTQRNQDWLTQQGYRWITVRRMGRQQPPDRPPDAELALRTGRSKARAWRMEQPAPQQQQADSGEQAGAEPTEILVWSPARQAKEDAIVQAKRERFESELRKIDAGLSRKHTVKRYDRVVERVGRLKERFKRVASHYEVTVRKAPPPTRKGGPGRKRKRPQPELAAAVKWKPSAKAERSDLSSGTYMLRASQGCGGVEEVVRTYWKLSSIEQTFRFLKGEVDLRPIWHSKPERIRAHLFLGVLAYHAVHVLRRRMADDGRHWSWATIRRRLEGWVRITTTMRDVSGRLIENRQDTRPGPEAAAIAQAAGVQPRLHRRRVT